MKKGWLEDKFDAVVEWLIFFVLDITK